MPNTRCGTGTISPGTYPNQTKHIRTIGSPNVLVTRSDIPDEAVYQITKVIWENLATLQEIHGATKDMRLDIAIEGLWCAAASRRDSLLPGSRTKYPPRG